MGVGRDIGSDDSSVEIDGGGRDEYVDVQGNDSGENCDPSHVNIGEGDENGDSTIDIDGVNADVAAVANTSLYDDSTETTARTRSERIQQK